MSTKRKLQVCNGYLLEFDQLARVLNFLAEKQPTKKILRSELIENTGLAERQIESLVSIGCAMGLILSGKQILSPVGRIVARHDVFIEMQGSLEWCHYTGAGTYKNLIWFDIFNNILPTFKSITKDKLSEKLREIYADQYTKRTIGKHLQQEVRFVLDAYLDRNFKRIEILHTTSDDMIYQRRHANVEPLIFAAILYDYAEEQQTKLLQISDLIQNPGAPGLLFGLDRESLRQIIEGLHEKGWIRYESTHNLDQIRLRSDFNSLEFLTAYYESREPRVIL